MIMLLKKLGACSEGIEFAASAKDFRTAWETCKRADWMLWGLRKIGFSDDKKMRLFACACIRLTPTGKGKTIWDLLNDERSRNAVVIAERYANGEATGEELKAAADAAYAAYVADAAYAADAADAAADAAIYAAAYAAHAAYAADAAYAARAADAAADAAYAARAADAAAYAAAYAAADAADAAADAAIYAAAYAAADAAIYAAAYAAQSDLLRQWISWDEVEKALKEYQERTK